MGDTKLWKILVDAEAQRDALAAELRLAVSARDYSNDMLDAARIETAHHSRVSAGLQMRAELAESRATALAALLHRWVDRHNRTTATSKGGE
jgi:hypothetical protein